MAEIAQCHSRGYLSPTNTEEKQQVADVPQIGILKIFCNISGP